MPTTHPLALTLLSEVVAICRLEAGDADPPWASNGQFSSITRTATELSMVCPQNLVPVEVECERSWRCYRVAAVMDFSMIGVVSSLVAPLGEAGISVFVLSTFDTDYLLVKEIDLSRATETLRSAGHLLE